MCAGISLLLWLVLISDGQSSRLVLLHQKPYVFSQAVVGVLVFAGLLGSIALAIYQPVLRSGAYRRDLPTHQLTIPTTDSSRPALTVELGFLLLLPPINEVNIPNFNVDPADIHKFLGLVNQNSGSILFYIIFPITKSLLLLT